MYYLLEDNRIIDSEKEDVYVNEYQGSKWLHKNNEHKTCLGYIKKQSEDVFDLIDWEKDLIKIQLPFENQILHCKLNKVYFLYGEYKLILAIYKPDANGNYIKVWEKK